jgi:prepilin-type N-terminal cleavage/methylation domain-containing protein/prepilin-type processing-associated H-X9-DG protein
MARINRKAFTLVEMLVVIVIISMLVALLVPAVISARERARRASCMSRMDQLGKGITQYEVAKKQLPGYVNQFGGNKLGALSARGGGSMTWVVMILENIGRADLWKEWSSGNPEIVPLSEMVCASDSERRGVAGALSFAVNCGISDESTTDVPAYMGVAPKAYSEPVCGLFFDHDTADGLPGGGARIVTVALDEIPDGSQQTIMLSENVNASRWDSSNQREVGVIWWSAAAALPWATDVPAKVAINAVTTDPRYKARPSSYHPGGVNAIFADGHADFISDRVDYTVFRDQMIPDQSEVKTYGLIP